MSSMAAEHSRRILSDPEYLARAQRVLEEALRRDFGDGAACREIGELIRRRGRLPD